MNVFLSNKYTRWYFSIIEKAKHRSQNQSENYENHHIIPKSLGGNDDCENLVLLTYREHFICHLLLIKMVSDIKAKNKMLYSYNMMSNFSKYDSRYIVSLKEKARIAHSQRMSGSNHPCYGKKQSEETIQKRLSSTNRELLKSQLGKKGSLHPSYGIKPSDETRKKISTSSKGHKKPDGCQKGEKNNNYGKKHPGLNSGEKNHMYGKSGEKNPTIQKNLPLYFHILDLLAQGYKLLEISRNTGVNRNLVSKLKNGAHIACKLYKERNDI